MTIDPFWRDAAAIWGAGLSTFLALLQFLPSRPRFHLEPRDGAGSDLTIRIVNPAKRMRLVRELWRIRFPGSERPLGVFTNTSAPVDYGKPGALWIAIKSESEATVKLNCVDNRIGSKNRWLIVFGWQGSWIVPVWVPVVVYISTARAARLNAATDSAEA